MEGGDYTEAQKVTARGAAFGCLTGGLAAGCLMSIGVMLCLTVVGAFIGVPLIVLALAVPFAAAAVGGATLKGPCPFCGADVLAPVGAGSATCPTCGRSIAVRGTRYYRTEEHRLPGER